MSVSPCFCGRVNALNSWSRRWSKRSPSVNHRDKKELRGNEILQKRLEGMRLRKWGASTQKKPTKVSCFSHEEVFYAHLHRQEQVENKRLKWQTSHQYDDDCYTHTHTCRDWRLLGNCRVVALVNAIQGGKNLLLSWKKWAVFRAEGWRHTQPTIQLLLFCYCIVILCFYLLFTLQCLFFLTSFLFLSSLNVTYMNFFIYLSTSNITSN